MADGNAKKAFRKMLLNDMKHWDKWPLVWVLFSWLLFIKQTFMSLNAVNVLLIIIWSHHDHLLWRLTIKRMLRRMFCRRLSKTTEFFASENSPKFNGFFPELIIIIVINFCQREFNIFNRFFPEKGFHHHRENKVWQLCNSL